MTDFWPQSEGAVFDSGSYILPCYPEAAISEMSSIKINASTTAGRIDVAASTAIGDGLGIALKEATGAGVPERIPVLFYGAVKCTHSGTPASFAMGQFIWNSITTTVSVPPTLIFGSLIVGGGDRYILGMALQSGAATGDEVLVLVGKTL